MPEIITFGEALIDFVAAEAGHTLSEAVHFQKAAGGAPLNTAVGLARLGAHCGFMGQVGADPFGSFLAETLQGAGVDTALLKFSQRARTGLAFVSLTPEGERDFSFFRHPSADMLFSPEDIPASCFQKVRIFHFGSISAIQEPSRSATLRALRLADEGELLCSFDPNLRLNLWPDPETARETILSLANSAQIIKLSQEELAFLSGHTASEISRGEDLEAGVRRLWHDHLQLLVVTLGPSGCAGFTREESIFLPGFSVPTVDTTGAGDGFMAGLLFQLSRSNSLPDILSSPEGLEQALQFANAAGALTTTRRGAVPALPDYQAVHSLLSSGE